MVSDEFRKENTASPQNGSKEGEITIETSLLMDETKKKKNPEIRKLGDQANPKESRPYLFTRKQLTSIVIFCLSNFLSLSCVSLQAPFFPKTVS